MTTIELHYPLPGRTQSIPADHGYALLGAISRLLPAVHGGNGFALAPIAGRQIGNREMMTTRESRLVIRTTTDRIADFLPLAGKSIEIAGRQLIVGIPSVQAIAPSPSLRARLVTIKGFFDQEAFKDAVRRQLDQLSVGECEVSITSRRTIRIHGREIVGFSTRLDHLTDDDSIRVYVNGIGGRRHMGCGVFVRCNGKSTEGMSNG